jgi:hypothetical protein
MELKYISHELWHVMDGKKYAGTILGSGDDYRVVVDGVIRGTYSTLEQAQNAAETPDAQR